MNKKASAPSNRCRAKDKAACRVHGAIYRKQMFFAARIPMEMPFVTVEVERDADSASDLLWQIEENQAEIESLGATPNLITIKNYLNQRKEKASILVRYRQSQRQAQTDWEKTDDGFEELQKSLQETERQLESLRSNPYTAWEAEIYEEDRKAIMQRISTAFISRMGA